MPIVAKKTGGNFVPAPAGTHAAVCCDVIDLGMIKSNFAGEDKLQHKIRVSWQLEENMADGKPYLVSQRYTLSLQDRANLRKDLEAWRGRTFTDDELKGFDVETVVNAPCLLSVVQVQKDGDTWANVAAIMRLPKGMIPMKPRDYIRVKDRKEDEPENQPVFTATDDDIPF